MKKALISFLLIFSVCSAADASQALQNVRKCDWDQVAEGDNLWIHPDYVLCSVHAYNIGEGANPTDANQRELMNEAVRLKATVITQQMKQQYDFLEATIKRLETQLQKAVLVSKLEASGAASSNNSGTGSGGGNSRATNTALGIHITGAQDCGAVADINRILDCVANNISRTREIATARKDIGSIRKQIKSDLGTLNENPTPTQCADIDNMDYTKAIACLNAMNTVIATRKNEQNRQNQMIRGGFQ